MFSLLNDTLHLHQYTANTSKTSHRRLSYPLKPNIDIVPFRLELKLKIENIYKQKNLKNY